MPSFHHLVRPWRAFGNPRAQRIDLRRAQWRTATRHRLLVGARQTHPSQEFTRLRLSRHDHHPVLRFTQGPRLVIESQPPFGDFLPVAFETRPPQHGQHLPAKIHPAAREEPARPHRQQHDRAPHAPAVPVRNLKMPSHGRGTAGAEPLLQPAQGREIRQQAHFLINE